jgi:hypothetical protein
MTTSKDKPRPFRATWAGTCILTGKPYKAGADIYRCGNGYAVHVVAPPPGWYYPEGENTLVRVAG